MSGITVEPGWLIWIDYGNFHSRCVKQVYGNDFKKGTGFVPESLTTGRFANYTAKKLAERALAAMQELGYTGT